MEFKENRGIAYCGLACVLCSIENCGGCAADYNKKADDPSVIQCAENKGVGGCFACNNYPCGQENNDCFVKQCVRKKGIDGCYVCDEYNCGKDWGLLQGKRNKAFIRFAREFGKQELIDRLRINYENGITYHRPGGLTGDYDKCETEQEIYLLLKNGKPNPYEKCPEYESKNFILRLISMDDAEDLFLCYSDPEAQKIFNSDNCNSDFKFSTLEHMRTYIEGWLDAYKKRDFIRYSAIDKKINKAIGTMEIFGGERGGKRDELGVLRIDVRHEYENEESLTELLEISDSFFRDFNTEMFITKAIPEAVCRLNALIKNGYISTSAGDGGKRAHYYMKRSPRHGT